MNELFEGLFLLIIQPQAREKAKKEGFEVSVAKTSFKANTKALAENEGEGIAKVSCHVLLWVMLCWAYHNEYMRNCMFKNDSVLSVVSMLVNLPT